LSPLATSVGADKARRVIFTLMMAAVMLAETLPQHKHDAAQLRRRNFQGYENEDEDIAGQQWLCAVAEGMPNSQGSPQ
jgi:hypothetical protein